jgi:hypothetical protein
MHLSSPPNVPHVLPISVFLTWSPEWHLVRSTEHKALCYAVFSTPLLPHPSRAQISSYFTIQLPKYCGIWCRLVWQKCTSISWNQPLKNHDGTSWQGLLIHMKILHLHVPMYYWRNSAIIAYYSINWLNNIVIKTLQDFNNITAVLFCVVWRFNVDIHSMAQSHITIDVFNILPLVVIRHCTHVEPILN